MGHFFKVNVEELANVNKQYKIKDEMSAEYEAWTRLDTYKKRKKNTMDRHILEFVNTSAVTQ